MKITQFPAGHFHQIGRKTLWGFSVEHGFSGLVPEGPDHETIVSLNDTEIKAVYHIMVRAQAWGAMALALFGVRRDRPTHPRRRRLSLPCYSAPPPRTCRRTR